MENKSELAVLSEQIKIELQSLEEILKNKRISVDFLEFKLTDTVELTIEEVAKIVYLLVSSELEVMNLENFLVRAEKLLGITKQNEEV